jgi:hypothetical protein
MVKSKYINTKSAYQDMTVLYVITIRKNEIPELSIDDITLNIFGGIA